MKEINIRFIDIKDQRYSTCGDYWETDTSYEYRITDQGDNRKNMLILLHEMIEYTLCMDKGITEQSISAFDIMWEGEEYHATDEPGYDLRAPYRHQHIFAENIERLMAQELGVDRKSVV